MYWKYVVTFFATHFVILLILLISRRVPHFLHDSLAVTHRNKMLLPYLPEICYVLLNVRSGVLKDVMNLMHVLRNHAAFTQSNSQDQTSDTEEAHKSFPLNSTTFNTFSMQPLMQHYCTWAAN